MLLCYKKWTPISIIEWCPCNEKNTSPLSTSDFNFSSRTRRNTDLCSNSNCSYYHNVNSLIYTLFYHIVPKVQPID